MTATSPHEEPRHAPRRRARQRLRQGLLRLAPYGAAALMLLGLVRSGISESIDLLLYDAITSLRPAPSGAGLPITIVGIDEADYRRRLERVPRRRVLGEQRRL